MHRRHSRALVLRTLGALGVPAGFGPACRAAAAETYTLRYALSLNAASLQGMAALHFAAAVGRRSNGQMRIEVYPDGQLAKEQEMVDALSSGVIDIATKSTPWLVPLFPRFQVFDAPFLFKDTTSAFRVLDGPIGDDLFADLEAKGILGLGWGFDGFKELWTRAKSVTVPEDLKGLRMRIQPGVINVATYQALGVIPLAIDIAEAYTALTQRTVDGVDNPVGGFIAAKFYTLIKHAAMSNHILSAIPLMANKRKLEALPANLQKIIKEEGKAVVPFWRASYARQASIDIQFLKNNGVAFNEIQYAAFHKAVEPVYALVQAKVGGNLIERIGRSANI
jgi:TRAP-type transport system periplasmic protein